VPARLRAALDAQPISSHIATKSRTAEIECWGCTTEAEEMRHGIDHKKAVQERSAQKAEIGNETIARRQCGRAFEHLRGSRVAARLAQAERSRGACRIGCEDPGRHPH